MLAIEQRMREMLQTPGIRSVCLVDWCSGRALSCVGIDETDEAPATAAMLQAISGGPLCAAQEAAEATPPTTSRTTAQALEDVVVTEAHDHLLFAVLRGSEFCVQVRLRRDLGSLGFALRKLRDLADDVEFPPRRGDGHPAPGGEPPSRDSQDKAPPRRNSGSRTHPRSRPRVTVDRPVLERVLTALRSLVVGRVRTGPVVV
ncbi:hypothetical protein [Nocardiopsis oceani]